LVKKINQCIIIYKKNVFYQLKCFYQNCLPNQSLPISYKYKE